MGGAGVGRGGDGGGVGVGGSHGIIDSKRKKLKSMKITKKNPQITLHIFHLSLYVCVCL